MHSRSYLSSGLIVLSLAFTSCAPVDDPTPLGERLVQPQGAAGRSLGLIERVLEQGLPEEPVREAFVYFDNHRKHFTNSRHMAIFDLREHSTVRRFYLINLTTGDVDFLLAAHGSGSDPDHDGYAQTFSNVDGSHMSSLGFYRVAERYYGKYGKSLRLDGLGATNSRARQRAIVIHPASYVDPSRNPLGRSQGCPAVEHRWINEVVSRLEGGALLYAYYK